MDDPLVKPAQDLAEIRRLAGELEEQALHQYAAKDMPGGEAMAALAPVANLEAWMNRLETAERLYADNMGDEPFVEDVDHEPPLQTLLFWSEQLRVEHGAESDLRPTLESEAMWLTLSLQWIYDHEPHWADFIEDVRTTRVRLENILHDGERLQAGAPCLNCRRALIRKTDARTGGLTDDWRCPSPECGREYDEGQYRNAVAAAYSSLQIELITSPFGDESTWATAERAARESKRSVRTVRTWMREGFVRRACLVLGRREVVSVDDVQREDESRKRRNRDVA